METHNYIKTEEHNQKTITNDLRAEVQEVANRVIDFKKKYPNFPKLKETEDTGEVIANITLAYRHLEDAKMRLGKVIQAIEGVSVYDTPAK